jgi:hypothetical protein
VLARTSSNLAVNQFVSKLLVIKEDNNKYAYTSFYLKMEAVYFSEMLISSYDTARYPEDYNINPNCHMNLTSNLSFDVYGHGEIALNYKFMVLSYIC